MSSSTLLDHVDGTYSEERHIQHEKDWILNLRTWSPLGFHSRNELLELSEQGRLQQANLEVVQSFGTNLLEVLARNATTGHEVRRMLALAVLDQLVGLDRQAATIRFLDGQGFLKHLVESLAADTPGITELLTKPGGNVRYLYVFEAKLGLLVRCASHPCGAELLLQAGLMARLAELPLLALRPDLDAALLQQDEAPALSRCSLPGAEALPRRVG